MARRPGDHGRLTLTPRARLLGGWLVTLLLVLGIATGARVLGGNSEAGAALGSPSATAGAARLPIAFGTALDGSRLVPSEASTARFGRGDLFAYSVAEAGPASAVYVAVRRTGGGPAETVQEAVEAQAIPDAPGRIAFSVPAAILLDAFGPGTYLMLIQLDPAGEPIAEGTFELVEVPPSTTPGP